MLNRITNYLKAGYPCLYLVSHEEARIERTIADAAAATDSDAAGAEVVSGGGAAVPGPYSTPLRPPSPPLP